MIHGGDIYTQQIERDFSVNMNPYPIPEQVRDSLVESLFHIDRYPDPTQRAFRQVMAEVEQVDPQQVIGGNGASELLLAIARTIMPKRALLLAPSFYGYHHALQSIDCQVEIFHLKEEEDFVLQENVLSSIKDKDIVFLTNPNNPTGRNIDANLLHRILDSGLEYGTTIVVDECFLKMSKATGQQSMSRYIQDYPNLYIVNAFTKLFSIPGVRTGYVLSQKKNIEQLRRHIPEWNMSVVAQEVSVTCGRILLHTDFVEKSWELIVKERQYLTEECKALGFHVYPSDSSFLLLYTNRNLYEDLLKQRILIRDCSNFVGLEKGYYRIAVKQHADNMALVQEMRKLYENGTHCPNGNRNKEF